MRAEEGPDLGKSWQEGNDASHIENNYNTLKMQREAVSVLTMDGILEKPCIKNGIDLFKSFSRIFTTYS